MYCSMTYLLVLDRRLICECEVHVPAQQHRQPQCQGQRDRKRRRLWKSAKKT